MTHDAAAHEAGHAVAAWLLGRRVTRVALAGGPLDGPHTIDTLPDDRPARLDVASIVDDAVVFAAGTLAASQPAHPHGAGDHDFIGKLAASATYSDAEAQAFEEWVTRRAAAMVSHPHFRALHRHVTEALERDTMLDEDDFRVEVQRGDLRYRGRGERPAERRG